MQLQRRILQDARDTVSGQFRTDGAHDHFFRRIARDNKPADEDVSAGLHHATGGNVFRSAGGRREEIMRTVPEPAEL